MQDAIDTKSHTLCEIQIVIVRNVRGHGSSSGAALVGDEMFHPAFIQIFHAPIRERLDLVAFRQRVHETLLIFLFERLH